MYPVISTPVDPEDEVPSKGVKSWNDLHPGHRFLRRANQRMGTADVYKQYKWGEEDQLTPERLKKGYQMPVTQHELQSLVFNASENKLTRLETAQRKTQSMLASIVHKKGEFYMNYDRERKMTKETIPTFSVYQYKKVLSDRVKFFSALFRGVPLNYLHKKIPFYRRKDHLLQEFYDYKIPYDRALWCMKLIGMLTFNASPRSQKKALIDVVTLEISQACGRTTTHLLLLLMRTYGTDDYEESVDKWYYLTRFMRYMFKDGAVDKQEFLNDLTEAFNVFFIKGSLKQTSTLTLFMEHYIHFLKDLSSCLILARRAATLLCQGLGLFGEMNEIHVKLDAFRAENSEEFLGFEKRWIATLQEAFDGIKGEPVPSIEPRAMFEFLDDLPDAVYFPDNENKTVEELAEDELQSREARRKIWTAKRAEDRRKRLKKEELKKRIKEKAERKLAAAEAAKKVVKIKEEPIDTGYEKHNYTKFNPFNVHIKEEPMDYDEYAPNPPEPYQWQPVEEEKMDQDPADKATSEEDLSSEESLSSASDAEMFSENAEDSDEESEVEQGPLLGQPNEDGEFPKYLIPEGFFDYFEMGYIHPWEPVSIRNMKKLPTILPEGAINELADDPYFKDSITGSLSRASSPNEPIPIKELQVAEKKEWNEEDAYGHIKNEKKPIIPCLENGRYGPLMWPFYIRQGGIAIDPSNNNDEMDYSNPTPPELPPQPPQVEFESSPSASPNPPSEKDGEEGDKDGEKKPEDAEKEKEADKESKEEPKKEEEKEKAKPAEKPVEKTDEHGNDLIIPMNPEDMEALAAASRRNSARDSKDGQDEDAEKVPTEAEAKTSPEVAAKTGDAVVEPKQEEPKEVTKESEDVEMAAVEGGTEEEANGAAQAEKAESEEAMEVDEPSKETADSEKPSEAEKTEKDGKEATESGEAAEKIDVDKPEGEGKADEIEIDEDEIMIIEKEKHPDADFCEVVAVVEREKEKTPEKEPEPEKEKEKEKEPEKEAESVQNPEPVPAAVPETEVQVVETEPEKPKTPEPPRYYTCAELYELRKQKRREVELANIAEEIEARQVQDKKWEESTIHPVFRVYMENRQSRRPLHMLSAMVQYLACTVPECFIWNNLAAPPKERRHRSVPQLCGSPLDYLPCDLYELPVVSGNEEIVDTLRLRHLEIVRRSQAAEEKWLPNGADVKQFGRIIDACVDVIGLMDSIDAEKPNAIYNVSVRLFTFRERFAKEEALLRTKLMFKWCITDEREGSFRPVYVAKLLRYGMEKTEDKTVGGWNIMDLLFNFMATEGPKHGSKNYQRQFDSVIGIIIEMIREKIFTVTDILKELEKDQEIDYYNPLMARQRKQKTPKTSKRWKKMQEVDDTKLIHYFPEYTPKRVFMGKKTDLLERLLIVLPQINVGLDSDEYRIRRLLLFGLNPGDNYYFRRARHIYRKLANDFETRLFLEFDRSHKTVTAHKKLNQQRLEDCTRVFRAQTYHDQSVILERIVHHYIEGLGKFLNKKTDCVPSPEIVNIICELFEFSLDINGIFNFFEMVIPYLKPVDIKIATYRMDLLPDMYHTEIGFIFVSFFMKHYQRFLLHDRAIHIVDQCYHLVRDMIKPTGRMITCWGRVIAIFAYHARAALQKANPQLGGFCGKDKDFVKVFPNRKHVDLEVNFFNEEFAAAKLALKGGTLRYDSYNDFKWIVGNLKQPKSKKKQQKRPNTRYSFVIRSFMEAQKHGRNFERINELANYCANVTANDPPLSEYWIGAIKGLCCLSLEGSYPFKEMANEVDITDCSTHYALTTFISCLAGKAAFYIPRLLSELVKTIFPLMLRHDGRLTSQKTRDVKRKVAKAIETRTLSEAEPGVCLCLLIIAGLCCPGDEPFGLSVHYRGVERKKKRFANTADERILHMYNWFEMDQAMFRTLGHISQLLEALQSRCKDAKLVLPKTFLCKNPQQDLEDPIHEKAPYRPQFLFNIAKAVLFTICEQDWVTIRMYKFVRTKNMEAFNQDRLKQNCLGQQILRISLRRKTERENIHSLFEAHKISKKATVDKILSFMNLWNFRATLFDLMLMIKEISPDGSTRHAQQGAIAADALLSEIGKCCRDMFLSGFKTNATLPTVKKLLDFRFRDINKYWLIAPLVRMCPKPVNIPPQYANANSDTVAAKFLQEAAALVNTTCSTPKERLQQCAWAMAKLPFINMILTCIRCQKTQQSKDQFLYSLYMQLQREVHRNHNKKANWANRAEHRECNVLAVTFLSYIFKDILKPTTIEVWGLLLFQLMYYGVINPSREKIVFDTCYDMLQYMVLWTLVVGDNMNYHDRYGSIRVRWPNYAGLMKKIRKETMDRHVKPSRASVLRFLPIAKIQKPTISYKKYTKRTIKGSPKTSSKKYVAGEGLKNGRYAFLPEERPKTNAFDAMKHMGEGLTKGGWRFRMFQTTRLDKIAKTTQNQIRSMIGHWHSLEFHRSHQWHIDNFRDDVFLAAPPTVVIKTMDPVPDEDDAKKKATDKTAEKIEDAKKKAEEQAKANEEKKKNDEQETEKDNEKKKEAEKDKTKDAAKADDVTSKEAEKDATQNEAVAPVAAAAEGNKEMDTSTEKPAPVARSSPATRGRGGGRKRNSGARSGGPRAKRTNSRANAAEATANTEKATASGGSTNSSYHAAMRNNQPPMSNGSSEETKTNIRNLLNRKQEKRNSIADANAAAAAAAAASANAAAAAAAAAATSAAPPTAPAQPNPSGPTMMPNQPNPGMHSMNPGMSSTNRTMHAPPPYSSTSMNPFGNQPHFTAPMPPPITVMQHRSAAAVTPEERQKIMEEQMHQKLAQQQQLVEHQARQREIREREAREHQERIARENQAREEQKALERQRAMEESQRIMREREEARRREEEERKRYLAEQKRLQEEKMRQEAEERRREEERRRILEAERARQEEERLRREAEEQERLRVLEQQRLEQERIRKEKEEEALRLEKERVAQETRLREAREAEQRQRMEQMRMNQQYMNQQAPPYGQPQGQPQGQPPSYQQTSYQNPPGYDQQSRQQQNQPPNYQQSSHANPNMPQQHQPPAYQQDSQGNPQQQQARPQAHQQPFMGVSGQQGGVPGQQGSDQFARYNQNPQLVQQQMAARQQQQQQAQHQHLQQQQQQQQQQQRNLFGAQPDMQVQGGPKLMQAPQNEAHAQQYQHTQAQSALLQKEKEKQYLQAKQAQQMAAQQQQQRFGDSSGGNAMGRNNMPFGQQSQQQIQQQPGMNQFAAGNQPRLLPGTTINPNPMQASQLQNYQQQQPVLGQPGPIQPGGQASQQQQQQAPAQQQQFAPRQPMHTTPTKNEMAMRNPQGQMGQGQAQGNQGTATQGFGNQPGFPQRQETFGQQQQPQQQAQYSVTNQPLVHQQASTGNQGNQAQAQSQNTAQFGRNQDGGYQQQGFNQMANQQQNFPQQQNPQQQPQHHPQQHASWNQPLANQMRPQQTQQPQQQFGGADHPQFPQQQQVKQNQPAQGENYGGAFPGQQQGFNQQQNPAQQAPLQQMAHQRQAQLQHQQNPQMAQQQQPQQQQQQYDGYGNTANRNTNILNQSMEDAGLNQGFNAANTSNQQGNAQQMGQYNTPQNQVQYTQQLQQQLQQRSQMHQQNQMQQQQPAQQQPQQQQQRMAQGGMGQMAQQHGMAMGQSNMGQPGMQQPGMARTSMAQQQQQQPQQQQVPQQQRQMGAVPPYSMGQQQQQPMQQQGQMTQEQFNARRAQMMQMSQQRHQQQMAMQQAQQQAPGQQTGVQQMQQLPGYNNQAQQQQQYRGQAPQGMGNQQQMQQQHQFYQNEQRMAQMQQPGQQPQQQQQPQQPQQQQNFNMGQYQPHQYQ